jgi:DNA adenine methylase
MDSFLRWAGSKRQLLGKMSASFPQGSFRYIEPFAGSACLFFHLEPAEAILGDLNSDLIRTLRAVQRDVSLVLECLRRLRKGEASYYSLRRVNPGTLSDAEAAARFIFLNHYCFNGIFRTNLAGQFNVPYGPPKNGSPINEERIVRAARGLQTAVLYNGDFSETIAHARRGDFVYLDPPYAVESRRVFSDYIPGTFSKVDLHRLGEALEALDSKGAQFLISYGDSPEARHLLKPWRPRRIWTRRNVAGFVGDRRGAYELLATNLNRGKSHAD